MWGDECVNWLDRGNPFTKNMCTKSSHVHFKYLTTCFVKYTSINLKKIRWDNLKGDVYLLLYTYIYQVSHFVYYILSPFTYITIYTWGIYDTYLYRDIATDTDIGVDIDIDIDIDINIYTIHTHDTFPIQLVLKFKLQASDSLHQWTWLHLIITWWAF